MNFLQKVSETGECFTHLLDKEVVFKSDILSLGGEVIHHKGEKAFISDVEYTSGHWSRFSPSMYIEPKVTGYKINGIPSTVWHVETFEPLT